MLRAHGLIHQTEEEGTQDARRVLHVAHQRHHQQRSNVHPMEQRRNSVNNAEYNFNFFLNSILVADAKVPLRFQRLDKGEQEMFVANELLELHHGRIVVSSRSGQTALLDKREELQSIQRMK